MIKNYNKLVYKLRFSLELEAEFPEKVNINLLRTRYRKLLNSWTVVTDNSMNNGLEFKPANKNKLYLNKESFNEISEILHIIRKHNGKTNGAKCGLHIHIDVKKLSDEELIKIVKEMIAKQSYMITNFKVNKNRLQHYCKFITKKDIKGLTPKILKDFRLKKSLYGLRPSILENKYFVLNFCSLQEYGTIEFRFFNGTKYLREIKKIINYLYSFLVNALERD